MNSKKRFRSKARDHAVRLKYKVEILYPIAFHLERNRYSNAVITYWMPRVVALK